MAISTLLLNTNDELEILEGDNIYAVSLQTPLGAVVDVTGEATFISTLNGTRQVLGGDTLSLTAGEGMTIVSFNAKNTIGQLKIKPTTGTCNLLIQL